MRPLMAATLGLCTFVTSLPVLAQEADAAPTAVTPPDVRTVAAPARDDRPPATADQRVAPGAKTRVMEEIVVTATKREENLQSVPIAISAFSGEKLDAVGITSAEQLPKITPGLTFSSSAGYSQVYLRGVGNDAFLPSADPDVPFYLDGVALLGGQGSSNTLGRVERVEVLKGPQGTLFGRNSVGGAISIVTPDPNGEFNGDFSSEIGNYNTRNVQIFVNLPIVDGLAATVAAYSESHDTFNVNDAGPTFDTYTRGARIKLLWHVSEDLSFNAAAMLGAQSGNAGLAEENTRVAPVLRGLIPQDPKLDHHFSEDILGGAHLTSQLLSGGGEWKLPWTTLKLIGSHQKLSSSYVAYDYDGSTLPLVSFDSEDEVFKQSTGELQVLSTPDAPLGDYFSWVAGIYYLDGKGGFPDLQLRVANGADSAGVLSVLPGLNGFITSFNGQLQRAGLPPYVAGVSGPITAVSGGLLLSKSISTYFQGTVHLKDLFALSQDLNLIVGARLDRESRGLSGNRLGAENPLTPAMPQVTLLRFSVPEITDVQVPLKFQLQWLPLEDTQLYAGFSRGFTAPTYSTVNFFGPPPPIKPQKVDSYELGAKLQLFDHSLTLNTAAFWIEERNLLTGFASLTSGGIVEFDNAPAARIRGLEADFVWAPLRYLDPGLVLFGSASFLDAKYTDYPNGRGYDPVTGLSFGPGNPIPTQGARDFSGNDISRTPRFSYNLGINQSMAVNDNSHVEINLATNYSDGYYYDSQNAPEYTTPSFQLFDASLSYFYDPLGLQLTAFGKNLTQTEYVASTFVLDTGRFQTLNDPRTFGLRFKLSF